MAADLAQFRDRLKDARRYLVGRIAEDDDSTRKFPDSGWLRILATLQTSLDAVEAVVPRDRLPDRRHRRRAGVERRVGAEIQFIEDINKLDE